MASNWEVEGTTPSQDASTGGASPAPTNAVTKFWLEHLAEDVLEDAAVFVVIDFFGGVDAGDYGEFLLAAVGGFRGDLNVFARRESCDAFDVEDFVASEAVGVARFAWLEFERENAHADEVAAMDALVAFGDDGAGTEQARAFGGPVTG